jgi:GNAT superfamily N-acetyltransferase
VRPAVAGDAEELVRLSVTCHGGILTDEALEVMGGDLRARLGRDPDLLAFVVDAPAGGRLAASVWGLVTRGLRSPKNPSGLVASLSNLSTDLPFRRQGHGTALVRRFVQQAQTLNCWGVQLVASEEGLPLYKALGFSEGQDPRLVLKLDQVPVQQSWRPKLHHFG